MTTSTVNGVVTCDASGKRCLSFRQAGELVNRARGRGERVERYHCDACRWWHFGHYEAAGRKRYRRRGGRRVLTPVQ